MPKTKTAKHQPAGPPAERNHADELRYRATRWAELHANPKTRPQMDAQLLNLNEDDQRCVILNGQRLAKGLPYKDSYRKETHEQKKLANGRTPNATGGRTTKTKK